MKPKEKSKPKKTRKEYFKEYRKRRALAHEILNIIERSLEDENNDD